MALPDRPVAAPVCAGIVLAAGAGTRYGKPKALAEGGAWLRGAVAALRGGGCDPVIVVLGATGPDPGAVDLPADVVTVWAADWATGLGASVRAGLIAAARTPARYAAIMPVDTPDVGADVIARVTAAAFDSSSGLARAVFHNIPGHPVVLSHNHWTSICQEAVGDSGARTYLAGRADMVCVTCDDLATGVDRDYPASSAR
ncbi:NTP transferase domain-containing protein [Nocardia brasiliensis]|uniref:NTP transferase domain-containing protein n=1 Tax=Nocardia brasiliensis TaxID=37326 RepID=A0A6G9XZZ6_NOCBR|nr:nucleotidyltransferase family protein [Nocardia brasiliensis]QIS06519.1 NTP transferase domain-containing protein [Nocardia brasiliensis]